MPQNPKCKHDKRKTLCRECGGGSLCVHDRPKWHCKHCKAPKAPPTTTHYDRDASPDIMPPSEYQGAEEREREQTPPELATWTSPPGMPVPEA